MRLQSVFRACQRARLAGVLAMLMPVLAAGQVPAAGPNEDPLGKAPEMGVRFTPEMARAYSKLIVHNAFVRELQLDPAKEEEATELMARRVMAAAHATDGKLNDLLAFSITQMAEASARGKDNELLEWSSPEVAKGLGERVLPMIPAIKDLFRGVSQDMIPMLPFKSQMKLTAGMAAGATALDAFEKNMQRWARGDVQPDENPFQPGGGAPPVKDQTGQTKTLQDAKRNAQSDPDLQKMVKSLWEAYLANAKKYYALDAAQCATGDAVLREYLERARILGQNAEWQQRIGRVRMWQSFVWPARVPGARFFNDVLNNDYQQLMGSMNALGDEFRSKIDEIPTEAQRQAAENRVEAALATHGWTKNAEGH